MNIEQFEGIYDLDSFIEKLNFVLQNGGVVALPSDAGYVLLVDFKMVGLIERIRKLLNYKQAGTFLVGDKFKLDELIDTSDEVVSQLIEEYLPGKIVIETDGVGMFESSLVRVRMIDSNLFTKLANKYQGFLLCFEAGKIDGEPIYSDEQFLNLYADENLISLFVNDGTLEFNRLPDIVKVSDLQISFVREGELVPLLVSQFSVKA
jgi:tRNA A37 threonylcarbamoyladenosine synthetase subunit TsaC/SUA5/YrdC